MMSIDKQFAYFNMFEMIYPHLFLGFERLFKPFFALTLPKKRPMDNVRISSNTPQEEENGIANLCGLSINLACVFPNNRERYLKYGSFDSASEKEILLWKTTYMKYLKKLSIKNKGKQLLIKSPAQTFRIKLLLELFPNAKFIHIKRDPYTTYFSIKKLYQKLFPIYYLQKPKGDDEEIIFHIYKDFYEHFLRDKKLIPNENYLEISYENLEINSYDNVRHIYNYFQLKWDEEFSVDLHNYLKKIIDYQKNVFEITDEDKKRIYSHWKEIIDLWNY